MDGGRVGTRVGTSGWSYDHWENVLYPAGTPSRNRLKYYLQQFDTVELNASFYRWPRDASFASWRQRLPEGFTFSVKAPRGLSHGKRLNDPEPWVDRIKSAWHELGDRRGVLLVQLPPDMERDDDRLAHFLGLIPRWMRVAVEFRHHSWHEDPVYKLLEKHHTAYCIMSGAQLPCVLRATAPFVYIRMHGPDDNNLYGGSYSKRDLRWWAERIAEWEAAGKDVFVYFNNDGDGNAVRNAQTLRSFVGDV